MNSELPADSNDDAGSSSSTLRVLDIIDGTIVDGPGLRTSIYLAGCAHQCPGCHNPESWDFAGGTEMSIDQLVEHVRENDFNVTLSGGDPLYQLPAVIELCRRLRGELGKNIWLYTGFTIEQISASPTLRAILGEVDTIVEGPFVEELRDITLRFRGSSNQRIIQLTPQP